MRVPSLPILTGVTLCAAVASAADQEILLPHYGRLLGAEDVPVEGEQTLLFRLWSSPVKTPGESAVWSEDSPVKVTRGLYNVVLGSLASESDHAMPYALFKAGAPLFLSVAVNGGPDLDPRLPVGMVPRASWANVAGDVNCTACIDASELSFDPTPADASVTTAKIAAGAVTTDRLGEGAVTAAKLADKGVTRAKLADGSIGAGQLADGSVETRHLADGGVTGLKLANDAVGAAQLAEGAVGSAEIADLAVVSAKIAEGAVGSTQLASAAVGTAKLAANAVTGANVAAATLSGTHLQAGSVTWDRMSATGKIAAANLPFGTTSNDVARGDHTHDFSALGAYTIPVGTTGQRPASPAVGMLRFNTTTALFEGWDGALWEGVQRIPPVVTSGLELNLDAANSTSYGGTGNIWSDLSGGAHHATKSGVVNFDPSEVGGSFSFDGGGFNVTTWPAFQSAPEVTIEVWAKFRGHRSTNNGIVTNFAGGAGKFNWMWSNSTGAQAFHNNGTKGSTYSGAGRYAPFTWYRFALRYDKTSGFEFFVNNAINHTQAATGDLANNTGNLGICMREDAVEQCDAKVGLVRLYTRKLTNAELAQNFEASKTRFGY